MQKRTRAIIISGREVLLIKRVKQNSVYWVFPGGGVEKDEKIIDALFREIKEEIGVEIKIKNLFRINRFRHPDNNRSKEFFYLCEIISGTVGTGNGPEFKHSSGYEGSHTPEWVELSQIMGLELRPTIIRNCVYFKFFGNNYVEKISNLNKLHYAGEVPYYVDAPIRKVESVLLSSLSRNTKLLDVGCGSGRFSYEAAKYVKEVIAVDFTTEAINAATQKACLNNLKNIKFTVGDATNLPFPDSYFDYVFCPRFVINAIPTFKLRKRVVKEMIRVSKKHGTIFMESFNLLYLGKGLLTPMRLLLQNFVRHIILVVKQMANSKYDWLLPGDIIYESNKVSGAPLGYAHLPTLWELVKLTNLSDHYQVKRKFLSIPQIVHKYKFDPLKFFRYSTWIIIEKK